jgi:hypothetical protein
MSLRLVRHPREVHKSPAFGPAFCFWIADVACRDASNQPRKAIALNRADSQLMGGPVALAGTASLSAMKQSAQAPRRHLARRRGLVSAQTLLDSPADGRRGTPGSRRGGERKDSGSGLTRRYRTSLRPMAGLLRVHCDGGSCHRRTRCQGGPRSWTGVDERVCRRIPPGDWLNTSRVLRLSHGITPIAALA